VCGTSAETSTPTHQLLAHSYIALGTAIPHLCTRPRKVHRHEGSHVERYARACPNILGPNILGFAWGWLACFAWRARSDTSTPAGAVVHSQEDRSLGMSRSAPYVSWYGMVYRRCPRKQSTPADLHSTCRQPTHPALSFPFPSSSSSSSSSISIKLSLITLKILQYPLTFHLATLFIRFA